MYRLFASYLSASTAGQLLSISALFVLPSLGWAQEGALEPVRAAPIVIAIVEDGPSPGDTVVASIEREVTAILAARGERAIFKRAPEFDAGWRADRMEPALRAALDDPEVDVVVAPGALITQAATQIDLGKPVISACPYRCGPFRSAIGVDR
jgi:hypothetical protein